MFYFSSRASLFASFLPLGALFDTFKFTVPTYDCVESVLNLFVVPSREGHPTSDFVGKCALKGDSPLHTPPSLLRHRRKSGGIHMLDDRGGAKCVERR